MISESLRVVHVRFLLERVPQDVSITTDLAIPLLMDTSVGPLFAMMNNMAVIILEQDSTHSKN